MFIDLVFVVFDNHDNFVNVDFVELGECVYKNGYGIHWS